jgi:hypothetical protein
MKVSVWVACTATPSRPPTMLPVSALRPLGTSMDSTGQRRLLT